MGWRGVTRSLIAASRAAERENARRTNAINRARQNIGRISDRLDSEIRRDLEKVGLLDIKMAEKPITFGEIAFRPDTNDCYSRRFADNKGAIKWSFALKFTPEVAVSGVVEDGCRIYELMAAMLTRWGVVLAFRISVRGSGRSTKLLSKSNPANNKIFLIADGVAYRAIDGDLDTQLPPGTSSHGVVAFPLPPGEPLDLAVDLVLRGGSSRLQIPAFPDAAFDKARNEPSLVDMVKSEFEKATASTRADVASAHAELDEKASAGGGWWWVIVLLGVIVLIGMCSNGA